MSCEDGEGDEAYPFEGLRAVLRDKHEKPFCLVASQLEVHQQSYLNGFGHSTGRLQSSRTCMFTHALAFQALGCRAKTT